MTQPTYEQRHIIVPAAVHTAIKRQAHEAGKPIWRYVCEKLGIPEPVEIPRRGKER